MWTALVTVVPVGLVLGLLEFGRYGTRRPVPPTPGRVIPVAVLAVLAGPVAVAAAGLATWFLGVAVLSGALLFVMMLRTPPPPLGG